jgi:hypothetical protein
MFAHHILHGYYSPASPNIDLGNGPGYPLILVPFILLHAPYIFITVMNAIFYYLSIVTLYKALNKFVSFKLVLLFTIFWGFYLNIYENLYYVLSETFASFLVSLITLCVINSYSTNARFYKLYVFLSGFLIGYLALTKPIFGYVLLVTLAGCFCWLLFKRKSKSMQKITYILLIAFITTSPYLLYTYNLTGQLFYWGSNGGNNLYWMSTPYEGEYGNWIEYPINKNSNRIPQSNQELEMHHKDLNKLLNYPTVRQDQEFKEAAITNIKAHPFKFIQNCLSNAGRILFNFPYSYELQKPQTLIRLPFNGIIIIFLLLTFIPAILCWSKIFFPIRFLIFFAFLYLAASILGSAETRMFTVIVPVLLIWIAYILQRTVKIKFNFDDIKKV